MSYKAVMIHGMAGLRSVRPLNCDDDLVAMLTAKRLLELSRTCVAAEVWNDGRRVGRVYRPTDPSAWQYPVSHGGQWSA